jgi:hypothetical protein
MFLTKSRLERKYAKSLPTKPIELSPVPTKPIELSPAPNKMIESPTPVPTPAPTKLNPQTRLYIPQEFIQFENKINSLYRNKYTLQQLDTDIIDLFRKTKLDKDIYRAQVNKWYAMWKNRPYSSENFDLLCKQLSEKINSSYRDTYTKKKLENDIDRVFKSTEESRTRYQKMISKWHDMWNLRPKNYNHEKYLRNIEIARIFCEQLKKFKQEISTAISIDDIDLVQYNDLKNEYFLHRSYCVSSIFNSIKSIINYHSLYFTLNDYIQKYSITISDFSDIFSDYRKYKSLTSLLVEKYKMPTCKYVIESNDFTTIEPARKILIDTIIRLKRNIADDTSNDLEKEIPEHFITRGTRLYYTKHYLEEQNKLLKTSIL